MEVLIFLRERPFNLPLVEFIPFSMWVLQTIAVGKSLTLLKIKLVFISAIAIFELGYAAFLRWPQL